MGSDFSINGEARLDTSGVNESISGMSALMQTGLNSLSVAAGNLLTKLTDQAAQMAFTAVSTGLAFNRQMENYSLAFENLLGDAEAANAALSAIKADAAATPFDVAGLVSANRLLISTGQSAEEARQVINALGNAVSASGGGSDELQRMAANLQQIANVGEAQAVDIKQFAYAGIDIYGLLADYTGLARDKVQDLKVSYDLLAAALKAASAEGGRYAGAMEAYSQTLQGRMDTLADNAAQLAGALAEGLFEAQSALVEAAAGWVDTLKETLETEGPAEMLAAGVQIAVEIAEGIVTGLPQLVSAAAQLVADFSSSVIQRLPALANAGGRMIGGLISGLLGMTASLGSAVGRIVAEIIEFFLSGDFLLVGVEIIEGIIQGFMDALPTLIDTVVSAVTGLADSAKQAIQGIFDVPIPEEELPYHQGSEKDEDYWKQVGQHYADTGQDQRNGEYNVSDSFDLDAYLASLGKTEKKAAQQTETLAEKVEKAMDRLGDSFVYTGDAVREQASRLAALQAAYDTAQTNVGKYKQLLDDSISSSGAASEMSQYLAQQLEKEESAVEKAKQALEEYRDSLDAAKQAARLLEETQEALAEAWSESTLAKLKRLAANLLGGRFGDALEDAGRIAWQKLDTATRQQLVDLAQGWLDTLESSFAQEGFAGLVKAGKTIAESLAAGLQGTGSATGALLDSVLSQLGISGGVEGLLSVIAELGPAVLGVAAAAAAVAAGIWGVASAFAYTVEQSRALQTQVQELTASGQALTGELGAALDVLQPFLEQSSEMLASLDELSSLLTDTLTGIGVEIMETMTPIIQEILEVLLPVLESLQPALEAAGDLLRTLLELFGNAFASALTALQPVLQAVGPLLETLALLLNSIASILSILLTPALQILGEVLNGLLQPVLWVAEALDAAVRFVVDLINTLLRFLGLKTIDLPDNSAGLKGEAFDEVTSALEENTEALKEQTELIRNPPSYQISSTGPAGGAADYSAMLAAARAAIRQQNTQTVSNYDAGSGQTAARLNASWQGTSTTVLNLDGREVAKATREYMDEELAF